MSMYRHEVTPATRIMLPAYMVFFAWIGLSNIATPVGRLMLTPALRRYQETVDVRVWGVLFLLVAASLAYAMAFPGSDRARPAAAYVLLLGAIVMGIWMCFAIAAALYGEASPGAGAYAFLPAVACYASYRAITRDA